MKIISKFKDFYDHKVAKYGSDPVLVFDRRQPSGSEILHNLPKPPADWQQEFGTCAVVSELYVGNLRVFLFATDKQVYSSYDIESVYLQPRRHHLSLRMVRFLDGSKFCLPQFGNYYWTWYQHFQEPDFSPSRCNRSPGYTIRRCRIWSRALPPTAECRCCSPIMPTRTAPPGSTAARILPKTPSSPASASISTPISCGSTFANIYRSSKAKPKPARPCPTKTKSATRDSMSDAPSGRK